MTLAMDLAWRGVDIPRRAAPAVSRQEPRCSHISARSMEIYRGLVSRPHSSAQDLVHATSTLSRILP